MGAHKSGIRSADSLRRDAIVLREIANSLDLAASKLEKYDLPDGIESTHVTAIDRGIREIQNYSDAVDKAINAHIRGISISGKSTMHENKTPEERAEIARISKAAAKFAQQQKRTNQ
jgi:hypothetical protein